MDLDVHHVISAGGRQVRLYTSIPLPAMLSHDRIFYRGMMLLLYEAELR